METLPKRKFTAEFRTQAVKLVRESDVPQAEAARQLGMQDRATTILPVPALY
jgi:transposase-like protein